MKIQSVLSKFSIATALLGTAFVISACGEIQNTPASGGAKALAVLSPTAGNSAAGKIALTERSDGVSMQITLRGLSPGDHGFHVHETGDCSSSDGKSAGGHFAPGNMPHGAPGDAQRHVGDLGNVVADAQGNVDTKMVDKRLKLTGPTSIIGKAFIVHGGVDDLKSQPSGAAGPRVACGVIKAGT